MSRAHFIFRFVVAMVLGAVIPSAVAQLRLEWARTYRLDPGKANQASKILVTNDGVIVGGTSINASGDADYVAIKYKANGDEAWVRRYDGGPGSNDTLRDMAVDPLGYVLLTGTSHTVKYSANGSLIWSSGMSGRAIAANINFAYITGFSDVDISTAQLAGTDGHANWIQTYDGPYHDVDISDALLLTASGDLFVAGTETTTGSRDVYGLKFTIFKYGSDGSQIRLASSPNPALAGGNNGIVRSLLTDGAGFLYLYGLRGDTRQFVCFDSVGNFVGSSLAGYDSLGQMVLTSGGNVVIARDGTRVEGQPAEAVMENYITNGTRAWQNFYTSGNPGSSTALGVVFMPERQRIYATGFTPSATGDRDLFVAGYSIDGTFLESIIYDSGSNKSDVANSIVADDAGNLYVTGYSTTAEGGTEFLTVKFSQHPKIEAKTDGVVHLEFPTSPGQQYTIEGSTDFSNWQSLITNTADSSGLVKFDDTNAVTIPFRFYRGKQP